MFEFGQKRGRPESTLVSRYSNFLLLEALKGICNGLKPAQPERL
jgi:hypothetical protein